MRKMGCYLLCHSFDQFSGEWPIYIYIKDGQKFALKVSKPRHAWTLLMLCSLSLSLSLSLSIIIIYIPSKHAGSNSHHLDWLRSIGRKWAGWFLHIGLLPDRICLAKTWHNQPKLNQIQGGFAQYYLGCLWKKGTESESAENEKLVVGQLRPARNLAWWFLHTSLLPNQMCLAKPWPGHPDRIRVSFVQYDPFLLWKNRTEMDAGSRIWHIPSRPIVAARWP